MNTFYIFTPFVFIKVEPNSLDIFSRIGAWVVYEIFMLTLFIAALVIALFGSLIVSDYSNVVFRGFYSDELNGLRFLFVQIRQFFYSDFNFFLSA